MSIPTQGWKQDVPAWKLELCETFEANNCEPVEEPTMYMKYLANKYDTNVYTIRTFYYTIVKNKCIPEYIHAYNRGEQPDKHELVPQNDEWKQALIADIQANRIPKVVSSYLNQFAEQHGANVNTVRNYYYRRMKAIEALPEAQPAVQPEPDQPEDRIDMKANAPIQTEGEPKDEPAPWDESENETKQLPPSVIESVRQLQSERSALKLADDKPDIQKLHLTHRKGTVVDVRVTRVESYGAFVECLDGTANGLIHISQVKDGFISNIHRFFRIGMVIQARIIEYSELDGKFNFSTRNLSLSEYSWKKQEQQKKEPKYEPKIVEPKLDFADQLAAIKEKLVNPSTSLVNPSNGIEHTAPQPIEGKKEQKMDAEWQQAKPFIEKIVGTVSEAAEQELRKIMEAHGVFAFTMALMNRKDGFTPDIGLLLANAIKQDLNVDDPKEAPRSN